MFQSLLTGAADLLERLYLPLDRAGIAQVRPLRRVPRRRWRQAAYAEWCHTVGIFRALLVTHAPYTENARILDVGCGAGLLAAASEPLLGHYTGIDLDPQVIAFCQRHYPAGAFSFQHLDTYHPLYAPDQTHSKALWDVRDASVDVVVSRTAWTHLAEEDARFYFREINRALRPGGRAILGFFLLDDVYHLNLERLDPRWVFNQRLSENWYHPAGVRRAEAAIAITPWGVEQLLAHGGLKLLHTYPGSWKQGAGLFFRDVLVFEKT